MSEKSVERISRTMFPHIKSAPTGSFYGFNMVVDGPIVVYVKFNDIFRFLSLLLLFWMGEEHDKNTKYKLPKHM